MIWFARWAALFAIVVFRYLLFAGTAYLVCWRWKRYRWLQRKIQPEFPPARALRREFAWSLVTSAIFAAFGVGILYGWEKGWTQIYSDPRALGWIYLFVSLPLLMALHDAYFYWTHRLLHRPWFFRHIHLVHHQSSIPSPWAAFSFHYLEAVIEAAVFPLLVLAVPVHWAVFLVFLMVMTVLSVINHLGYELYPSGFARHRLGRWVISATHHDMHHRLVGWNFGLYFTWWDRWYGSEHPDYPRLFDAVKGDSPPQRRVA